MLKHLSANSNESLGRFYPEEDHEYSERKKEDAAEDRMDEKRLGL